VVCLYDRKLDLLSKHAKAIIEEDDIVISPTVVLELEYLYEIKRISIDALSITG
jgi:hypothetical protein